MQVGVRQPLQLLTETGVVVRVGVHGPVEKFDTAAGLLEFFKEENLVDIIAGEAGGSSDEDEVEGVTCHL